MAARRFRWLLGVLAVALGLSTWLAAQSTYRVVRVVDGDTVVLEQIGTARLIGVDTPETVDPRKQVQAFGKEASAFLTQLIARKDVRVEYDQTRKDRYERTLVYLYLPDGTLVNREIIRRGFGHAYTQFPFRFMEEFRAAEREARTVSAGLWAIGAPRVQNGAGSALLTGLP